jgi:RNA polymerase sigma factor (sigma-70 family)
MLYRQLDSAVRHIRRLAGAAQEGAVTDRQLLDRFVTRHEQDAFALVLQRHAGMVLGVCRRVLRDRHEAEDVFQATFLVLARKAPSGSWCDSVGPWLHEVAYRLAMKTRAGAVRREEVFRELASRPVAESPDEFGRQELRAVLDEELRRLPQWLREPVILCYLEGKTNSEAAAQLGWQTSTLKGRLARARERLRARLVRRGLAFPAALSATAIAEQAAPAAVPAGLLASAARVATLLAMEEGGTPAGVSLHVVAMADGMVRAMLLSKLKIVAAGVALLLGFALTGMGLASRQAELPASSELEAHSGRPQPAEQNDHTRPAAAASRVDFHGDPLPPGAIARLGSVRFFHGGGSRPELRVTLSPDGRFVVSYAEGQNRLWDAVTGAELPLEDELRCATFFAALGRLVAVDSRDGQVRIKDLTSGQELDRLTTARNSHAFALSANGRILAWCGSNPRGPDGFSQNVIFTYDLLFRKLAEPIDLGRDDSVYRFALSADGKILAAQHDKDGVQVWDLKTRTKTAALLPSGAKLFSPFALSPDGSTLAVAPQPLDIREVRGGLIDAPAGDRQIHLWNTRAGKPTATLVLQPKQRFAPDELLFAPDGKHLVAVCDHALSVWDLDARKEVRRLQRSWPRVSRLSFSADGKWLASDDGGRVVLWDWESGKPRHEFGHGFSISAVAFSSDGKTIVTGSCVDEPTIRVWEARTGRLKGEWRGPDNGT